jgi:hypothetical protein
VRKAVSQALIEDGDDEHIRREGHQRGQYRAHIQGGSHHVDREIEEIAAARQR